MDKKDLWTTRRTFMAAGAILAAGSWHALALSDSQGGQGLKAAALGSALKDVGARKGIRFGASARVKSLDDPAFVALLLRECNVTAALNEMKWGQMNHDGPQTDYAFTDRFVDWAATHGLRQRGHTLVWDKPPNVPVWIRDADLSSGRLESLIVSRCTDLCSRYKGRVQSWDVVNEAIEPNRGTSVNGPFYSALGWQYADAAFHAAHAADPAAELVYNDYVIPGAEAHQTGILRLLEGMLSRGVPVHALGIQGHLWMPVGKSGDAGWQRFLAEVADLGLTILVTELDVVDNGPQGNPGQRDMMAGQRIEKFLDVTLAQTAVKEVVCRSLSDKYEGLTFAIPRADRAKRRPSPFDGSFKEKPIAAAIRRAFENAPAR